MKNFLSTATTVVLTLCALVLTGILVRREFFPGITATAPREVEHWSQLASAGHTMGPANAPVRILEFSDFQCPYCARLQPTLQAIRAKYPDRVAVVYRHFPLADHPHAMQAALASECAAAQGRFERFHDILYAAPDSIGVTTWDEFARRAGVPKIDTFQVCVEAKQYQPRIEQDLAAALSISAPGTPTLIVNGRMFSHNPSPEHLDSEVRRALRNAQLARH